MNMTQESIEYRKAFTMKVESAKTTATKYNGMSYKAMENLIDEIKADYKAGKITIQDLNNCHVFTMTTYYKSAGDWRKLL